MRGTSAIILLLSLLGTVRNAVGFSFTDATDYFSGLTTTPTCDPCQYQEDVPSSMTIVHSDGVSSIDIKFNSTLELAWEQLTSYYMTQYYTGDADVTGLGCTSKYQYIEKTSTTWTIYFTLHLEYDTTITTSAKQIAQTAFTSLDSYNSYFANLGLNLSCEAVTFASTKFPTKAPVTALPTKSPTKKPITAMPIASPTEAPAQAAAVTSAPTESPSKKPVTASPVQQTAVETPVSYAPAAAKATPAPTKAKTVKIPTSMTITSTTEVNFETKTTFITEWESTTSAYYTTYYQKQSGSDSFVSCHAKYLDNTVVQTSTSYEYTISYVLYVEVQYSSSYSYSKQTVISTVESALTTDEQKTVYTGYLNGATTCGCKATEVIYPTPAPSLAPAEASSPVASPPTASPVSKTLITKTVEGSLNYTTSSVTKIVFSDTVINVLEKATSAYITKYYSYNDDVQDLTVTAKYQGSTVLYECGCTTIVYFSYEVSYTSSTYTPTEIITTPFDSKLSRLAYTNIVSKLGVEVELEGTSLDDTYSTSVSGLSTSAALKVGKSGLLTFIAGAVGIATVLSA